MRHIIIVHDQDPSLYRVKQLCSMKTERREIAVNEQRLSFEPHAERTCRPVDHLQSLAVGNLPITCRKYPIDTGGSSHIGERSGDNLHMTLIIFLMQFCLLTSVKPGKIVGHKLDAEKITKLLISTSIF